MAFVSSTGTPTQEGDKGILYDFNDEQEFCSRKVNGMLIS